MSTNWNDTRAAIETAVKATIGTNCTLLFENDFSKKPPVGVVWARCTIQNVRTDYGSIGSTASTRMRRTYGIVYLQIFTPENKGTAPGLAIADIFADGVDSQVYAITNGQVRMGITNVEHVRETSSVTTQASGHTTLLCACQFQRDVFG